MHRNISLDNILLVNPNDIEDIKLKNFLYSSHWTHHLNESNEKLAVRDVKGSYLFNAPEVLQCDNDSKRKK